MRTSLVLLALATLASPPASAGAQSPPPGFDDYVRRVMERFEVPGLSVAIVKDDHVVLAKGYGVRALGAPERVD
ncbi:MAG TPA: hypothetical protein VLA43_06850, partial [Longimicrobiales bacterium]|nr:hypothetical protein [Longimicrobiales bacterium]